MDYHSGPNVGFWANILWKSEKCGKVEIIEICNIRTWLATTGLKMELVGGGAGGQGTAWEKHEEINSTKTQ